MAESITAYPLSYPMGWQRTPRSKITRSRFGDSRRPPTVAHAIQTLQRELRLLAARDVVISTNLRLRLDGLPYGSIREPEDTGAAIYFKLNGNPRVLACDRWLTVGENIYAIARHIDAVRAQSRWGVGTLDQAFTGYAQLEAETGVDWRSALGLAGAENADDINFKYRFLVKKLGAHPDAGAESADEFHRLTRARDAALKELENGHTALG